MELAWPTEVTALIASIVSMLGGVCTVLAGYLETSPVGRQVNALEELSQACEFSITLERSRLRLENDVVFPLVCAEIDSLINELNEISIRVTRLVF
jgi:hypothetical protein